MSNGEAFFAQERRDANNKAERAASPNELIEHPGWHSYGIQHHVLCSQALMPA